MALQARILTPLVIGVSILALTACDTISNIDLRGPAGSAAGTEGVIPENRPEPDARGVISYPGYQVAVAQPGDTVASMAARLALPAEELASYNNLKVDSALTEGELLALPERVSESAGGPVTPGSIDITTLAGDAIDRSESGTVTTAPTSGTEPKTHRVQPGETAFTIARQYNVPVESLAEWNGLNDQYEVREAQFLLIPPVAFTAPASATAPAASSSDGGSGATTATVAAASTAAVATTTAPGEGSPTPTPPSASEPLPTTSPSPEPVETPKQDALEAERTTTSTAQFQMPVAGSIVRDYDAADFTGVGIAAPAGSSVVAADAGEVMLITRDTNQNAILVVRHEDDLLTVYSGIEDISVERGDKVSRGQKVAEIKDSETDSLFFQVRKGNDTYDPLPYLQ